MTDVSIPFGAKIYWNPRRALITILWMLAAAIAVLSWSAVKAETKKQDCNSILRKFVIQTFEPDLYAEKCGGCPPSLGLRLCLSTGAVAEAGAQADSCASQGDLSRFWSRLWGSLAGSGALLAYG